jgi:hypothetical protein
MEEAVSFVLSIPRTRGVVKGFSENHRVIAGETWNGAARNEGVTGFGRKANGLEEVLVHLVEGVQHDNRQRWVPMEGGHGLKGGLDDLLAAELGRWSYTSAVR